MYSTGFNFNKPLPGALIDWTHPLARGLAHAWLLNQGGGQAVNAVTHAYDGTLFNGPTQTVGNYGQPAINFPNGMATYVDCGNVPELVSVARFSAAFAFKRGAAGATLYPWGKNTNAGTAAMTGIEVYSDGSVYLDVNNSSGADGHFVCNDLKWHYLVEVFDGQQADNASRLQAWLDGAKQSLAFSGTIPAATGASANTMTIGRMTYNGGGQNSFGAVDHLLLWNRALSAQDAEQLSSAPFIMFRRPQRYYLYQQYAALRNSFVNQAVKRAAYW